ncbi:hypothetical protein [Moheibacter stercoris]|uniref:Uncharacterized protein n=1 Tax=Moheibacter stercoris TaxID=1628251 RepID=A0ABV2LW30_9FLAO
MTIGKFSEKDFEGELNNENDEEKQLLHVDRLSTEIQDFCVEGIVLS